MYRPLVKQRSAKGSQRVAGKAASTASDSDIGRSTSPSDPQDAGAGMAGQERRRFGCSSGGSAQAIHADDHAGGLEDRALAGLPGARPRRSTLSLVTIATTCAPPGAAIATPRH